MSIERYGVCDSSLSGWLFLSFRNNRSFESYEFDMSRGIVLSLRQCYVYSMCSRNISRYIRSIELQGVSEWIILCSEQCDTFGVSSRQLLFERYNNIDGALMSERHLQHEGQFDISDRVHILYARSFLRFTRIDISDRVM